MRMMCPVRRLSFVALLLAFLPASAPAEDAFDSIVWRRYQIGAHEFLTDVDRDAVLLLGQELAHLEFILARLFPAATKSSAERLRIVMFSHAGDYLPYEPFGNDDPMKVPGYYRSGEGESLIVMNLQAGVEARRMLYHEFIHSWLRANYPWIPAWLNEGLAEYFSTVAWDEGSVHIGRPIAGSYHYLRSLKRLFPPRRMAEFRYQAVMHGSGRSAGPFYAQSWLTVHYLMSHRLRQDALANFVALTGDGMDAYAASRKAFGMTDEEFVEALKKHLKRDAKKYMRVSLDGAPESVATEVRDFGNREAACELARLWEGNNDASIARAKETYETSLAADSTLAVARLGLARVAMLQSDWDAARGNLRAVIAADESNFEANMLLGRTSVYSMRELSEGREALVKALARYPEDPYLLGYYACTWVGQSNPAKGLQAILPVTNQLPRHEGFVGTALVLMAEAGDADGYERGLEEYRSWASPGMLEWVEREAGRLLGEGDEAPDVGG